MDEPTSETKRALVTALATRLFINGETTEALVRIVERYAAAIGAPVTLLPRWGEMIFLWARDEAFTAAAVAPTGVHMGRVAAIVALAERVGDAELSLEGAEAALHEAAQMPDASTPRFAMMAAAGAAALGVIFGVDQLTPLLLIAASAGLGGWLRRAISHANPTPVLPPFAAALLAGLIGVAADDLHWARADQLIVVCPCMVLVPGPHFLNGAIDLIRTRISLGLARLAFAGLIVAAICAGVLLGLTLGGQSLPPEPIPHPIPFLSDILAAGVAVAAYGSFFSMPWRVLGVPVAIGMIAHSVHWLAGAFGASLILAAFLSCLLAGGLATLAAHRLKAPFAALAFSSVVSLIPGVFLFRAASALVQLPSLDGEPAQAAITRLMTDGSVAVMILLAMTAGVIAPRILMDSALPRRRL